MDDERLEGQPEGIVNPQAEGDAAKAQSGQETPAGEKGTEPAEPSAKGTQSHEDNRRYQAARVAGERAGEQKGYDRAVQELTARITALGFTDPAQGRAIGSMDELERYARQARDTRIKNRAEAEKRPVAEVAEEEDARELLRRQRREAEEAAKEQKAETARKNWVQQDVRDFAGRYPEVDLKALIDSRPFLRFCGSRYGREPLAELYEDYMEVAGEAQKAALVKAESKTSRATGTGGGSGSEALTAAQQRELDDWNRENPGMKMTAKEFLKFT